MNLTNEQVNSFFDVLNTHLAKAMHEKSVNYTDKVLYRCMNIFANFENVANGDCAGFWQDLDERFVYEALKEIGAEDLVALLEKTRSNAMSEISEIKGLFKGGKIKAVKQKYAEDFISRLNDMGGIDSLTDNYYIPYAIEKYKGILNFGF